jgi:S-methylmethionine-dependent homocysteine/selenocysteine methylase
MSAYDRVRERLEGPSPVILGGPMGSELVRRGVRWRGHGMLTDSDAVLTLYGEYFGSGADVVRTNTFQLNRRIYLDVFRDPAHMRHIGAPGLERRAVDLTRQAVRLARQARSSSGREDTAIAGVMSPLEHCFRPDLAPGVEDAREEHGELAAILAEEGADLILLESMNTLTEARVAAAAAQSTGLPFWVSFAVGPDGLLLGGELLPGAARAMRDMGAEAVLVNGVPPDDVGPSLEVLMASGPAGAFPLVGKYDPPSWKFEFFPRFCETERWPPERLAEEARSWYAGGARILGSCGGSGPHYTRAFVESRERGAFR